VYGYVRGGTEDEQSLRANYQAFDSVGFMPRGLNVVDERDVSTELWGRRYTMPLGIAPTGLSGLVWHECDRELALAAKKADIPFIISGSSSVPLERLQQENPDNWYQAYFPGDRARMARILERLSAADIGVLVVTIDTCVAANRENNARLDFTIPFRMTPRLLLDGMLHPRWSTGVFLKTLRANGVPRFANLYEEIGPPITQEPAHGFRTGRDRLCWDDIAWLREQWKGRLVLKGVMHPADAIKAEQVGADGIIVSNHGGRQLDGTLAPLTVLPEIVDAVPPAFPVMIDGGFRRGTDVLKAIALGASLVFTGRATLYGAAVAGEAGVERVLSILAAELDRDMALLGCARLSEVTSELLGRKTVAPL
jgi:L-lactate dehydrogenase (cytochrome)